MYHSKNIKGGSTRKFNKSIGAIPTYNVDLLIGNRMTGTLYDLPVSDTSRDTTWIKTSFKWRICIYNLINKKKMDGVT